MKESSVEVMFLNDSEIIGLFFERSERAITELSAKYGALCTSVAVNILHNESDAEECVSDAYLGVWNAIPPACPDPLSAFVCRIVRNISIKRLRSNNAAKRRSGYDVCIEELAEVVTSGETAEDVFSQKELSTMIDGFIDTLGKVDRMIFVRRYWYTDSYESIAKAAGMREGAVRTRASRIRASLKRYLAKRGVDV